jgi:hypothetical protein
VERLETNDMPEAVLDLLGGINLWIMALGKYPYNQKGFERVYRLSMKYKLVLKILGTILISYSMLLGVEYALGIQGWHF